MALWKAQTQNLYQTRFKVLATYRRVTFKAPKQILKELGHFLTTRDRMNQRHWPKTRIFPGASAEHWNMQFRLTEIRIRSSLLTKFLETPRLLNSTTILMVCKVAHSPSLHWKELILQRHLLNLLLKNLRHLEIRNRHSQHLAREATSRPLKNWTSSFNESTKLLIIN